MVENTDQADKPVKPVSMLKHQWFIRFNISTSVNSHSLKLHQPVVKTINKVNILVITVIVMVNQPINIILVSLKDNYFQLLRYI